MSSEQQLYYESGAPLKVELLASTPDAQRLAFAAIRSCYSADNAVELFNSGYNKYAAKAAKDGGEGNEADRLIRQIVNHGHTSTLEHISFSFAVSGLSRAALAQLTRHRVAFSFSVQSQRYVKFSGEKGGFGWKIPDLGYVDGKKEWGTAKACSELVKRCYDECQRTYDRLLKWGVNAEDARCVLPQGAVCNLVVTCNLRSFLDAYGKRVGGHAQAEIQELFVKMGEAIVEKEPWIRGLMPGESVR